MKNLTIAIALAALAAAGCRDSDDKLSRGQKEYEVVQEGSAAGVATTLGDVAPTTTSTPPLTDTNADTTSAFTLDPTIVATTPQQPGTIAGTLPPPMTSGTTGWNPPRRPVATPRPAVLPPATAPEQTPPPVRNEPPVEGTPAPEKITEPAPPQPAEPAAQEPQEEGGDEEAEEPAEPQPTSTAPPGM